MKKMIDFKKAKEERQKTRVDDLDAMIEDFANESFEDNQKTIEELKNDQLFNQWVNMIEMETEGKSDKDIEMLFNLNQERHEVRKQKARERVVDIDAFFK